MAASADARGDDTLADRNHRVLDLGGRDPDAVWALIVQHARNINAADLQYSIDIADAFPGSDLNSNTVAASVLHTVGINVRDLPTGVLPRDVSLYDQVGDMNVNDRLVGGDQPDLIYGGAGNDRVDGGNGNDRLAAKSVTIPSLADPVMTGCRAGWERIVCAVASATTPIMSASATACYDVTTSAGGTDKVFSGISLDLTKPDLAGVENALFRAQQTFPLSAILSRTSSPAIVTIIACSAAEAARGFGEPRRGFSQRR